MTSYRSKTERHTVGDDEWSVPVTRWTQDARSRAWSGGIVDEDWWLHRDGGYSKHSGRVPFAPHDPLEAVVDVSEGTMGRIRRDK